MTGTGALNKTYRQKYFLPGKPDNIYFTTIEYIFQKIETLVTFLLIKYSTSTFVPEKLISVCVNKPFFI